MEPLQYQKTKTLPLLIKPVFYIATLVIATFVVLKVEKLKPSDLGEYQKIFQKEMIIKRGSYYPVSVPSDSLGSEELGYARTAWKYFENNYNPNTGLVNGIEGTNAASLNDISSYMMAMMSAYELGIIEKDALNKKMTKLLATLARLPLYDNKVPNKYYHTETLQMLDNDLLPSEKGAGWSGLQVGRFYSVMLKMMNAYPQYSKQLKEITSRWNMDTVVMNGYIYGTVRTSDNIIHEVQEGTLGYEEYCAKGLMMSGYDVSEAMLYTDFLKYTKINDKEIPVDTRATDYSSIPNYLTSDPYIYDGLEYGWDLTSKELAFRIYKVQEARFTETGIVTAVGEDPVDAQPGYTYNCVYAAEEEWNCIDQEGNPVEDLRTISTKTAFGWYALFDDKYAQKLLHEVRNLHDPLKGWYAGKYEKTGKANKVLCAVTNGTVLEALNYRANGKIVSFAAN
jgi:hypothetical protein